MDADARRYGPQVAPWFSLEQAFSPFSFVSLPAEGSEQRRPLKGSESAAGLGGDFMSQAQSDAAKSSLTGGQSLSI